MHDVAISANAMRYFTATPRTAIRWHPRARTEPEGGGFVTPTEETARLPPRRLVFRHACKMGLEGIVSKRLGSRYRSGRSPDWLKFKNPEAPAVRREAEEEWRR